MKKQPDQNRNYGTTCFGQAENKVWLERLFGLVCGFNGHDRGPQRARGLVSLSTSLGCFGSGQQAFSSRIEMSLVLSINHCLLTGQTSLTQNCCERLQASVNPQHAGLIEY